MTTEVSGGSRAHLRDRWIAWLFIVGSSLFALGAVPFYADAVGLRLCGVTFFVGSLFFTTAAFLQYREAVDALPADGGARRGGGCDPATMPDAPADQEAPATPPTTASPST